MNPRCRSKARRAVNRWARIFRRGQLRNKARYPGVRVESTQTIRASLWEGVAEQGLPHVRGAYTVGHLHRRICDGCLEYLSPKNVWNSIFGPLPRPLQYCAYRIDGLNPERSVSVEEE